MPYTIKNLRVKNFKCFDSKKYYQFNFHADKNPTILSGPNGFGKTTFFDAIELIFTKKITRLQTTIERGNANLKKNILINEADKDGILVLSLSNENQNVLTIIATIDHSIRRLNFGDSIKYSVIEGTLDSDEAIANYLIGTVNWQSSLAEIERLKFSPDHFNVYYYVSQAESVHFLKNSIVDRKNSMNVLLNTKNINDHIDYVVEDVIGGNRTRKGVIVNDGITSLQNSINTKVENLKQKIEGNNNGIEKADYIQLLNYPKESKILDWDLEQISVETKFIVDVDKAILEIKKLHNYALNYLDYENHLHNQKIRGYIENQTIINDVIEFSQYLENGLINKTEIENLANEWKQLSNIFNYSMFFRKQLDVDNYKKDDLVKLKEVNKSLITVDIDEITTLVDSIKDVNTALSGKQKLLENLNSARKKLNQMRKAYDDESSYCPFCNQPYASVDDLESAYENLTKILSGEESLDSQKKQKLLSQLSGKMKKDFDTVMLIIKDVDEKKLKELNTSYVNYERFIKDKNRIKAVETVDSYTSHSNSWLTLEQDAKTIEIQRILQENIKSYNNIDFDNDKKKYNFDNTHEKFKEIFKIEQEKITNIECVEQKINYLNYTKSMLNNDEIKLLKSEIKQEMVKLKKVKSIRGKIENLKNIYQSSVDEYKNQILKKLRVPLLIYTGKILQDYQNGLGVFVSRDEMRFVSNGDAKHDILNTFSSGQLSGFVLAFLFSMNKQYIVKSNDDIGFILVDDPVQTMDDINIASLIEVLRNDFSSKQIILSTHETDKENYILYKFLKYNLIGQSLNVQEELYV